MLRLTEPRSGGFSTEPAPDGLVFANGIGGGALFPEEGRADVEEAFAGVTEAGAAEFLYVDEKVLEGAGLGAFIGFGCGVIADGGEWSRKSM